MRAGALIGEQRAVPGETRSVHAAILLSILPYESRGWREAANLLIGARYGPRSRMLRAMIEIASGRRSAADRRRAAGVAGSRAVGRPRAARPKGPWAIELFTSQGCNSCPPADCLSRQASARRPDIVALSFHVDYWDYIGWKDRFAIARDHRAPARLRPRAEAALRLHARDGGRRHRPRHRAASRGAIEALLSKAPAPLAQARHA